MTLIELIDRWEATKEVRDSRWNDPRWSPAAHQDARDADKHLADVLEETGPVRHNQTLYLAARDDHRYVVVDVNLDTIRDANEVEIPARTAEQRP